MQENKNCPETNNELSDLQKTILECVKRRLKKEKRPQRMLAILRWRFEFGKTIQQTADHVGLGRNTICRKEKEFIAKIAEDMNTTLEDVRNILAGLPLGTEKEMLATKVPVIKEISVPDLFKILCQHIKSTPTGLRIVKEPVRTLQIRMLEVKENLSQEDAELALKGMKKQKLIEGEEPWREIKIIPEVPIPEYKDYNKNYK